MSYLGSREDILLNDYYVWVTGVHSKTDIVRWAEFISQYGQAARRLENRAVYVIEYDGPPVELSGVEKIGYTVENYDCRVFCLETAAALDNAAVRAYQAEMALCIGQNDPELCDALLREGDSLLLDPVGTARSCIAGGTSSEGRPFAEQTEQQISSAAWKAAIVLLFPVLEQFRLDFVVENQALLEKHLPISNSNGDRVTDPFDLEIGAICYIVAASDQSFSEETRKNIRLCRRARNQLAHNKPLPYEDVQKLIAL